MPSMNLEFMDPCSTQASCMWLDAVAHRLDVTKELVFIERGQRLNINTTGSTGKFSVLAVS